MYIFVYTTFNDPFCSSLAFYAVLFQNRVTDKFQIRARNNSATSKWYLIAFVKVRCKLGHKNQIRVASFTKLLLILQ